MFALGIRLSYKKRVTLFRTLSKCFLSFDQKPQNPTAGLCVCRSAAEMEQLSAFRVRLRGGVLPKTLLQFSAGFCGTSPAGGRSISKDWEAKQSIFCLKRAWRNILTTFLR